MSDLRRYDFEFPVAEVLAQFLDANIDESITENCPVVTFFDPMSIDDANRIIILINDGETMAESPANCEITAEVVVKSQWSQAEMTANFKAHQERVNVVRDRLLAPSLQADMNVALLTHGVYVDFLQPRRNYSSSVYQEGFITSSTRLRINCFAVER